MYAQHFGLNSEPFSIAPDPRYLFMSERHREALAHLLYGVGGGGGFVLLTGEIGAGKTTVCRAFLEQIPRRCNVAYIFNPKLSVMELLHSVCEEFGIPGPAEGSSHDTVKGHIDALNEFLLRTHAVGQNNVLIIDEAQNLAPEVLEQLRLLTNLETSERKLLQIILIGQPELRTLLLQPELEQLAQRVIARCHLQALSPRETAQYIRHRLGVAGLPDSTLFEAAAAARVHQLTGGIPRRINLLCDRAMLGAYATGQRSLSKMIVDQAATEVFGLEKLPKTQGVKALGGHAIGSNVRGDKKRWSVWAGLLMGTGALMIGAGLMVAGQKHAMWLTPAWTGKAIMPSTAPWMPAKSRSGTGIGTGTGTGVGATSKASEARAVAPVQPVQSTLLEHIDWHTSSGPILLNQQGLALQALAKRWGVNMPPSARCEQAANQGLQCFRSSNGLSLIRQLERPVALALTTPDGDTAWALLTALGPQWATLELAGQPQTIHLSALSQVWHGDFMTWWRAPEGYRQKLTAGSHGSAVDWLAQRLAQVAKQPAPERGHKLDQDLQARLAAFQMSQGIKPDGMAGAMTFMQINRLTGVDEPQLATERARVLHP